MGILDTLKGMLGGKADQVDDAIDMAADKVDDATGGKHTEHIDTAAEKAKDVIDDQLGE